MGESEITPLSIERTGLAEPTSIAGRYTVIEKLGQGGMGRVYSAHDSVLDRTVAIKILFGTNIPQDYWKRFQMEARAASKLKHPAIVQVLDFGVFDDDQPFLVMEYMKGETMEELLARDGRLPLNDAISIIEQVCIGMEHAHNQQVLHRDLKPSNIMISRDGEAYRVHILDFGIAKVLDQVSPQETLTRTGQIVGSPRCMSPEQASGDVVDRRSDIYSLGCVAFEVFTGQPPYAGQTALETIGKHMFDPVPSVDPEGLLGVPESVAAAIERSLSKSPVDRFSSMREFADVISGAVNTAQSLNDGDEDQGLEDDQVYSSEVKSANSSLVVVAFMAVGVIVFTGTLVGGWLLFKPAERSPSAAANRAREDERHKKHELNRVMSKPGAEESFLIIPSEQFRSWLTILPETTEDELSRQLEEEPDTDTFNVNRVTVDEKLVDYMTRFPKFRKLRIGSTTLTGGAIDKLARVKSLSQIQFFNCDLPVSDLKRIAVYPSLEIIEFDRTPVTSGHMEVLSLAKGLKVIRFKGIPSLKAEDFAYLKGHQDTAIELIDCVRFNAYKVKSITVKYGFKKIRYFNFKDKK